VSLHITKYPYPFYHRNHLFITHPSVPPLILHLPFPSSEYVIIVFREFIPVCFLLVGVPHTLTFPLLSLELFPERNYQIRYPFFLSVSLFAHFMVSHNLCEWKRYPVNYVSVINGTTVRLRVTNLVSHDATGLSKKMRVSNDSLLHSCIVNV
jgi:hypothetical protein